MLKAIKNATFEFGLNFNATCGIVDQNSIIHQSFSEHLKKKTEIQYCIALNIGGAKIWRKVESFKMAGS